MRRAYATLALVSAVLAAAACGTAGGASPDLVLTNAKVFTADVERPWAEAVAIRGERVIAVGTNADVLALESGNGTRVVDVGGRTLVPGFNDAHVRLSIRPANAARLDLTRASTAADLLLQLADADRAAEAGAYLDGTIDAAVWLDPALSRTTLDRAVPDRPVVLVTSTGHGGLFNSAALPFLGVDEAATDPPGVAFGRDAAGRLDGRAHEYAVAWIVRRLAAQATDAEAATGLRAFAREALALGITSVQVISADEPTVDAVRRLREADTPLRWRIVRWPMPSETPGGVWSDTKPFLPPQPAARVRVSGLAWLVDGTPIERSAFLREPYADAPAVRGEPNMDAQRLRQIVGWAYGSEDPLHVLATGDAAIDAVLTAMEETGVPMVWQRKRPRIEHGDLLTADLRARARALGVVVVQTPARLTPPDVMRARLGARAADATPMKTLLAEGLPLAMGSDGTLNPYLNILFATRPARPEEALSRAEAVAAYTRGSAYAELAERDKGMLAPGALADLAVLSADPFAVSDAALPAIASVYTLVGGRVAHDAGVLRPAAPAR